MDLSKYDNSYYYPGRGAFIRLVWYFVNVLFLINPFNPFSGLKVVLLRLFGAKIGRGVCIKPSVNIKYPWNLKVGDYTWIGEGVWIDNLVMIDIGSNVCISQGAMLLCGNHNYKSETFDLITQEIKLGESCWVGAQSVVCPGVTLHRGAVLGVMSVASSDLQANKIYRGNPAVFIRLRESK
ncbi:MAG: WcaF family extracellular polysaccharide biosynthesis acetyltransferase [Rikenellaceae bacterium]